MSRNSSLLSLIAAYGFAMSSTPLIILVGGLIGAELAPDARLATLPISIIIVATALSTAPASMLMRALGRKLGFLTGLSIGGVSALVCLYGLAQGSFVIFTLGCALTGVNMAFVHQFRFAAMELVPSEQKAQAASWILIGGIFAAIAGPEAGAFGRDLFAIPYFGSFLLLIVLLLCSTLIIIFGYRPSPQVDAPAANQASAEITHWHNPTLWLAFATAAISYSVMSLVMTAAPLSMTTHGHDLATAKWVIQSHILAMFVPSLFTGWLIRQLGISKLIISGVVIYLSMAVAGLMGFHVAHYWGSLVLLGIGWNFLFVSGTTLLGSITEGPERYKLQATNEFLVFGSQALASLGAGWVLIQLGWQSLLIATLPLAVIPLFMLVWRNRRQPVSQ